MNSHQDAYIGYTPEIWTESAQSKYFVTEQWQQALGFLEYLTQNTQQILLLTGQPGVGKTCLKHAFLDKAEGQFKLCSLMAEATWDVALLMRRLAMGFGLEWEQTHTGPSNTRYHNRPADALIWVVVVDDAHLLPQRVLHALVQIAQSDVQAQPKLHLILVGDSQLESKLIDPYMRPNLRQTLQVIEVEPLNPVDCQAYANFKGFHQDEHPGLDFKSLASKTGGLPRSIDTLLQGSIMSDKEGDAPPAAASKPKPLIKLKAALKKVPPFYFTAVGSTLGASLITASLLSYFIHPSSPAVTPLAVPALTTLETKAEPEVQPKSEASADSHSVAPAAAVQTKEAPAELPAHASPAHASPTAPGAKVEAPSPQAKPQPTLILVPELKPTAAAPETHPPAATTPASTAPLTAAPEVNGEPRAVKPIELPAATPKPKSEAKPETAITVKPAAPKAAEVSDGRPAGEPLIIKPGPLSNADQLKNDNKLARISPDGLNKSASAQRSTDKSKPLTSLEQALLKVAPDHYTLQLLGTHSEVTAISFIQNLDKSTPARYYRSQYKGQDWFVVVAGDFKNRELALTSVKQLPLSLQHTQPWVHRYDEIHRILRSRANASAKK